MKSIAELLLKHSIPGLKEAYVREEVAHTIQEVLGISCTPTHVSIKNRSVYISLPPVAKAALHLKQKTFQETLSSKGITIHAIV